MKRKYFIALLKEFHITMWKEIEEKNIHKYSTYILQNIRIFQRGDLFNDNILFFNNVRTTITDKQYRSLKQALHSECFICGYARYKTDLMEPICNHCKVFPEFIGEKQNCFERCRSS